jgi:hypothetical protein
MKKRTLAVTLVLLAVVVGAQISGVSAVWRGSDTPAYTQSGEIRPSNFAVVDGDAITGDCEIKVNRLYFPYAYWGGTNSLAWIAGSETMSQSVTQTWYITAQWDIDYRIACAGGAKVTVSVVYMVLDSDDNVLEQEEVEAYTFESQQWDDEEYVYSDQTKTASFTTNLQNGYTYYFAVALKVYIHYWCRDVEVTARTDHSGPAVLHVDQIIWTDDSPI